MIHTRKGYAVLREKFLTPQTPGMSCGQQIPELIASVKDLVNVISSNAQAATIPETFSVREAAVRLGCSSGQVRKLVQQGKLGHHWLGKNLRFRQKDLEDFWASQTVCGSGKRPGRACSGNPHKKALKMKRDRKASPLPTRRDIEKLWR